MSYGPEWAWKAGDWWCACDRCGFKYRRSQIFREWTGEMVCAKDLDPRDPQTIPPRVWPEGTSVPNARPEPPNIFVYVDNPFSGDE